MEEKVNYTQFEGRWARLKSDFYTDDELTFGELIKAGSDVFIKQTESDGTCYVDWIDFVFAIPFRLLEITND